LFRSEFRRGITAIAAAATNTALTWDNTAGKNPDQDLKNEPHHRHTATGIRPNRILYGDTAFNKRASPMKARLARRLLGRLLR